MSTTPLHRTLKSARPPGEQRAVVIIGNFDGVHRGHQQLLARAQKDARRAGHRIVVLTFWPHPARFFKPNLPAFELMTLSQRAEHLGQHGADEVLALPFDARVAGLSPAEFVQEVLVDGLGAAEVIVGEDFHFGHRRAGNTTTLRELGDQHGFAVHIHEPVLSDNEVISSTRIRGHITRGELERANALLGRPYMLTGEVVHGDAWGRNLGFPTANVAAEQSVFLPDGIYTSTMHSARHGELRACTYIGSRPTYEEALGRNVETFVLDVPETEEGFDLYGEHVTIALHRWQRPDKAYEGSEALIAQMKLDVAEASAWHQSHS